MLSLRKKIGNVSKISANATAIQPTKIPADTPAIVRILRPRIVNSHFLFQQTRANDHSHDRQHQCQQRCHPSPPAVYVPFSHGCSSSCFLFPGRPSPHHPTEGMMRVDCLVSLPYIRLRARSRCLRRESQLPQRKPARLRAPGSGSRCRRRSASRSQRPARARCRSRRSTARSGCRLRKRR